MSDNFLDSLAGPERQRLRRRMRSEAEYERLREKVKGPEDLEKELNRAEQLADAKMDLQTNPEAREKARVQVERDLKEQGLEQMLDVSKLDAESRQALEEGRFDVALDEGPEGVPDQVSVVPEGNVTDRLPLKPFFSEKYVSQLTAQAAERVVFITVDGKPVTTITLPPTGTYAELLAAAIADPRVIRALRGREVQRHDYRGSKLDLMTR